MIATRQRGQVFDHRLHGRVETVPLDQLEFEALGQIPGKHPGRLQALQTFEHGLDVSDRRAEAFGDFGERVDEIAGGVDGVDQRGRDHTLDGIGDDDHCLPGQMLAERLGRRDIGLDVGGEFAVAAPAAPGAVPGGGGQSLARLAAGIFGGRHAAVGIESVLDFGAQIAGKGGRVGLQTFARPVAGLSADVGAWRLRGRKFGLGEHALLGALQQRIAFQLVFDEGRQFGVRHLQQLDRLQQLRRQHH